MHNTLKGSKITWYIQAYSHSNQQNSYRIKLYFEGTWAPP